MYEAPVFTAEGKKAKGAARPLPESIFDGTVHEAVLWQATKAYLANQRKGNASTRNRSAVRGGSRKPWRQKGTGRARQGTIRAPQWRGGGVVFGPTSARNHREELPRKVRGLARRSALNARAQSGQVVVFESLALDAPRTKAIIALLEGAGVEGKTLILTNGHAPIVHRSARNIPQVKVVAFGQESAYDVLWADAVLIEAAALDAVPEAEAAKPAQPAKKKRAAKAQPAKAEKEKPAEAEEAAEAKPAKTDKATAAEDTVAEMEGAAEDVAADAATGAAAEADAQEDASEAEEETNDG
ncbi:MAG TPA: 50S ribosomal protein L4 [Longimicrobiales bacterium]|nr:50S ribosomal protein L4 [Longimicrobiales bacterium]